MVCIRVAVAHATSGPFGPPDVSSLNSRGGRKAAPHFSGADMEENDNGSFARGLGYALLLSGIFYLIVALAVWWLLSCHRLLESALT